MLFYFRVYEQITFIILNFIIVSTFSISQIESSQVIDDLIDERENNFFSKSFLRDKSPILTFKDLLIASAR